MAYHIEGLPDDLPPGKYNTRVKEAFWFTNRQGELELMIHTVYVGPKDPDKIESLITFTKD